MPSSWPWYYQLIVVVFAAGVAYGVAKAYSRKA
jgi:hypothetical protein